MLWPAEKGLSDTDGTDTLAEEGEGPLEAAAAAAAVVVGKSPSKKAAGSWEEAAGAEAWETGSESDSFWPWMNTLKLATATPDS